MKNTTIIRKNPGYMLERIDKEILLYQPGVPQAIYLNETAVLVWELADGTRCVDEICVLIKAAFPDTPNLESEIYAALEQLADNNALESLGERVTAVQEPSPKLGQTEQSSPAASASPDSGRRSLIQVLAAGAATFSAQLLPRIWITPVVGSIFVPAHAYASPALTGRPPRPNPNPARQQRMMISPQPMVQPTRPPRD